VTETGSCGASEELPASGRDVVPPGVLSMRTDLDDQNSSVEEAGLQRTSSASSYSTEIGDGPP